MAASVLRLPAPVHPARRRDEARLRLGRPAGRAWGTRRCKLIAGKAAYLNVTGFVVRGVVYFVVAIVIVAAPLRLVAQAGRDRATSCCCRSSATSAAGGLPFIALAITFAAFDWLMSLNPTWFSTVFGVYYFGGSLVLVAVAAGHHHQPGREAGVFGGNMNDEHTHNIGKLMLAFACFWTYIAFSQLMLIWIAGLPDETPFYITRFNRGWAGDGHPPHRRPLFHPVRRAAVAVAQAQPEQAGDGWRAGSSSSTWSTSSGW